MREALTKLVCRSVYGAAFAWGYTSTYVKTDPTVEAMHGIAGVGRQVGANRVHTKRMKQAQLADQAEAEREADFETEEARG